MNAQAIQQFINSLLGRDRQSPIKIHKQFIDACEDGNLELIQQLFYNNTINISSGNEWAFRYACLKGHLHVAQWLLSVKPDINISADNEYAFRSACRKGNLQLAQWLLSVKPDINISDRDEEAFRRLMTPVTGPTIAVD